MKYIMLESKKLGQKFPIIFPQHFVHADVLQAIKQLGMFKNLEPISAGEITIEVCNTHGKSETLGLVSVLQDHLVIELHDVLHGMN